MNKYMIAILILASTSAFANKSGSMTDPTVVSACQGVWTACQGADVTDPKTGKKGYQFGEWKEGDGLWANCVGPLAHGKTVTGLSNPPTQQAAQGCIAARKNFCANTPSDPCHKQK